MREERTVEMCVMAGTVTKLSNRHVEELDELDRIARTAARQSGHSHAIAQLPALSSNGRVVGRLTGLSVNHACFDTWIRFL